MSLSLDRDFTQLIIFVLIIVILGTIGVNEGARYILHHLHIAWSWSR